MFDTLNNSLQLVEGYEGKWLKGKVTQNVDPKNLDRVQASVPGLYDPNLGDLPWIGPLKESSFGFGDGFGVFGTPAIGADILVSLQGGDPNYPVYMHAQCFPNPSEFPSGTAWGFKDTQGNKLVVQGKDIKLQTGANFIVHVDAAGDFTVTAPSGKTGTFNVDHMVFNSQTIATNGHLTHTGQMDIVGGPFNVLSGVASFAAMVTMLAGYDATGPATNNGHNIGNTHRHTGGTESGGLTGTVST